MFGLLLQLGLFLLLSDAPAQAGAAASATPEPPKPEVNVSLGRASVRENDCVPVEVWFSSAGEQKIEGASLDVVSPDFFNWSLSSCKADDKVAAENIRLEPAQSDQPATGSILHRRLYLRTGPEVEVGDSNLLFVFKYRWKAGAEMRQSLVTSEKAIKINLLGSDSVAGVPLALAGLVVPGLFFWIVARVLGVTWAAETPLGDKLVYSVMVSFALVALASALVKFVPGLHYLDVSSGISVRRLMWLAAAGACVGAAVSLVDYTRRRRRASHAAETEVNFNDDDASIMGKLLGKTRAYNPSKPSRLLKRLFGSQFKGYRPQTVVKLKDGQVYCGSLGERGADLTVLAGWFKVTQDNAKAAESAKLAELMGKGLLSDLFKLAKSNEFQITGRSKVKTAAGGRPTPTDNYVMVWPSADVLQVVSEPYKNQDEPLILAPPEA